MTNKKKPHTAATGTASKTTFDSSDSTPPTVTGQCALVLNLIRRLQPVKSLDISVGHAVPELAARVHDLRCKGFDVRTEIVPAVEFRGEIRRKVAIYSLGVPEWPRPGFIEGADCLRQLGLDLGEALQ